MIDIAGGGPARELSARAYAAIHLRIPDSGIGWLDVMIERAAYEQRPMPSGLTLGEERALWAAIARFGEAKDPETREQAVVDVNTVIRRGIKRGPAE